MTTSSRSGGRLADALIKRGLGVEVVNGAPLTGISLAAHSGDPE
jgi:hypothetical protein